MNIWDLLGTIAGICIIALVALTALAIATGLIVAIINNIRTLRTTGKD